MPSKSDSWATTLSGISQALGAKLATLSYAEDASITSAELTALYHGDDLAAKICDSVPEDATRQGWYLDGLEAAKQKLVDQAWDALDATNRIVDAWIWGLLYGGSLLVLGIDDGKNPSEPFEFGSKAPLVYLKDIDCRYISVASKYADPMSPKFGSPETYQINDISTGYGGSVIYHESRVIRFGGARTSVDRRARLNGWDDSILQKKYLVLKGFGAAWTAIGSLMLDASMVVFKRKNLAEMVAEGNETTIQQRLQLLEASRTIARALLIDMDDEAIERTTIDMGGYPQIISLFIQRMCAAAQMPQMILFGQSPSGLAASGDSEMRWYYDRVKNQQETKLAPAIRKINSIVLPSLGITGEYELKFNPLWNTSDKEDAEYDKMRAETIGAYLDRGVIAPEEITTQVADELGLTIDETLTPYRAPTDMEGDSDAA